jgi:hypothetical protein
MSRIVIVTSWLRFVAVFLAVKTYIIQYGRRWSIPGHPSYFATHGYLLIPRCIISVVYNKLQSQRKHIAYLLLKLIFWWYLFYSHNLSALRTYHRKTRVSAMKRKLARMRWKAKKYNLFLWETTITLVSLSESRSRFEMNTFRTQMFSLTAVITCSVPYVSSMQVWICYYYYPVAQLLSKNCYFLYYGH